MAGYMRKRGDRTWQFEYSLGTDSFGKRLRFTKTVHGTEREAKKAFARFCVECEDGKVHKATPTTVSDLAESYMENYSKRYKKQTTQRSDQQTIDKWIIPYLGNGKLDKLKKYDIQQWVNTIEDEGKSPKTVRNIFSLVKSIFAFGIDMDLMHSNPCDNVRLPKKEHKEIRCYTKDEVSTLLKGLENVPPEDYRFKCFILLALFGGFRKGEVRGFNWEDLDGNIITIQRTRYGNTANEIWEDTPKTEKSSRTIALPEFVVAELKKLKKVQLEEQLLCGSDYGSTKAIIRDEIGRPLGGYRVYDWFYKFCDENGIPGLGLHALRHTHASMLANLGADKVQVSNRLGHSQLSTTLNIYTHLFEDVDNSLAMQLDSYKNTIAK